ncbi:phosphatase PAP2 family protein [Cryobacterium tepidiphilum]|uniref:Phosphatase PAP2 family protein n=1 Tax=Cryobacterium tepidiphilum TaxID=2486026 RepID=A0A3M8LH40_9MICO|nr:phosphatase PAP2 family protein [Cryobacterium tepidiphilum]
MVDRGYVRLSNAANRSRLWVSIAAGLALFGRPRPALRGVGSLVVASILANLVGKKLFGGDRPLLKDIPVGRRLKKQPASASFPSGHSASAAAFATGVALESPRLGLAVAPVAAAVAYSRLHTGAHWFSDVVGGSVIGVATAALGKAIVPARSSSSRHRGQGGTPVGLPALPDGEGAFIVVNPASGNSTLRPDPMKALSARLPRAAVHRLDDGEDLVAVARRALESGDRPQVLGVAGGDGSVGAIAQVARDAGLPLLVLPSGTFNHFAGAAGIESVDAAIDGLLAGEGVRVDVAELTVGDGDPKTVLNEASLGVYSDFVAEREKVEARVGKWVGSVVAAVRVMTNAHPAAVTIDGRDTEVWSLFVGVGRNAPGAAPLRRRRLGGGSLDLRVLRVRSRARAVWSLSFGGRLGSVVSDLLPGSTGLEERTQEATEIRVHSREAQPLAHDGEVHSHGTAYTYRVTVVPGGLEVYRPFI